MVLLESKRNASGYGDAIEPNLPTTRYYYDGQMPVEEDYTHATANGTVVDLTKYGCGPRGMDYAAAYTKTGSGSYSLQSESYLIYDTHGNSMFMLSRSSGSYALGNEKNYDAWGGQIGTNVPQQGYCANLGHRRVPGVSRMPWHGHS